MRRFFAAPDQFDGSAVTLTAEETRHLRDVLRLRLGEDAHVFDGDGREFKCEIVEIRKSGATLKLLREVMPAAPESRLELTLAATVYKSDKLDLVIQKAVELGVSNFIPVVSFRSEAKLRDATKRLDRWRKIALEATKQCERARIMTVVEPLPLEDFLNRPTGDVKFFFSEKGAARFPTDPVTIESPLSLDQKEVGKIRRSTSPSSMDSSRSSSDAASCAQKRRR